MTPIKLLLRGQNITDSYLYAGNLYLVLLTGMIGLIMHNHNSII